MHNRIIQFLTIIFITSLLLPLSVFAQGIAVSPIPEAPVDYTLPYPGLLPDNPLYPLKMFRDQFISFLISNPIKKAEFELLQSDKHMQAGYLLIAKENKIDLATKTISEGNNYFDEALTKIAEGKAQGMNIRDLTQQLSLANRKHAEVITGFLPAIQGQDRERLNGELLKIQAFQKRLR